MRCLLSALCFVGLSATPVLAQQLSGPSVDVKECATIYLARPDAAILYCNRALSKSDLLSLDEHVLSHVARGLAYFVKRDYDAAIKDVQAAMRLDPTDPTLAAIVAQAHARMGRYAAAIKIFDDVIQKDPKNHFTLYSRGIVRLKAGDQRGAEDVTAAKKQFNGFDEFYWPDNLRPDATP